MLRVFKKQICFSIQVNMHREWKHSQSDLKAHGNMGSEISLALYFIVFIINETL